MPRTKTATLKPEARTRIRRNDEQLIKDLEAKIQALKVRAEVRKVKQDPSLKFIAAAVRNIDKALVDLRDQATRKALDEARLTLSACLELPSGTVRSVGSAVKRPASIGGSTGVDANALLSFIANNPGQRSEQITAEFDSDAATVRSVVKRLIDAGKVKTEGQRRGMAYFAA